MEINFELGSYTRKDGKRQILLVYSHAGRIRFSTGCRVDPGKWDQKRKQVKRLPGDLHVPINRKLRSLESEIEHIALMLTNPTPGNVKSVYEKQHTAEIGLNFWGYFERYKQERKEKVKRSTFTVIKASGDFFKKFETEKRFFFSFNRMNLSFFNRVEDWAANKIARRSYATYLQAWLSFLNYAYKSDWTDKNGWKGVSAPATQQKEHIKLTLEQVYELEAVQLSEAHRKYIDRFLFHCYTGLRINDAKDGNYEILNKRSIAVIKFRNNKKSKLGDLRFSEIPLIPKAIAILDKYGEIPQAAETTINKTLRSVAGLLEFPGAEKLTSHCARKTLSSRLADIGASNRMIEAGLTHSSARLIGVYSKPELLTLHGLLLLAFP